MPARLVGFGCILALVFSLGCGGSERLTEPTEIAVPPGLTESEAKLWRMSGHETQAIQRTGLLYQDPEVTAYVQALGERMVPAQPGPATYEFHVLLDPEVNAFAFPDGTIYVHLGLLSLLESEAQLAHVLAHEVVHVEARHSVKQYDNQQSVVGTTQVLSLAAAIGFGSMGTAAAGLFNVASQLSLGLTASIAVSGYSREAEREADVRAIGRIAAEGYDPCASAETFTLLLREYDDPDAVASFVYASHPRLKERQAYSIEEAEARGTTCAAPGDSTATAAPDTAYARLMRGVRADQVELWIRSEQYDRAIDQADRLLDLDDANAPLWYWRAEAIRQPYGDAAPSDSVTTELEEHYRYALDLDPSLAIAHRSLGALYEARGDTDAAAYAYEQYLATASRPRDRRFIQHRIDTLRPTAPADATTSPGEAEPSSSGDEQD
ncbi:MAG: M48 family metalloprotease [Bacteroidota bacterium]